MRILWRRMRMGLFLLIKVDGLRLTMGEVAETFLGVYWHMRRVFDRIKSLYLLR